MVVGEPHAARKGGARKVAMIGGVVALLGVGVVAIKTVTSDSASGGAPSPEAAMTAMLDAISDEDPLAMLDLLDPAEVGVIGDAVKQVRDALTGAATDSGLGQIVKNRDAGTLDPNDLVPGFQITFSGVNTSAESLGDNFTRVNLDRLSADWTFDAQQFESVVDVQQLTDDNDASLSDESGSFDEQDITENMYGYESQITEPFFVMKKIDGGWYISLVLTGLETTRLENNIDDEPEWGDLGDASDYGAASPEQATESMINSVLDLDFKGVVELLPPERYDSLYRYRRVFRSESGTNLDTTVSVAPNDVVRDDRGSLLPLTGTSISVTSYSDYDTSYEKVDVQFDNDCVSVNTENYDEYYGETNYGDSETCLRDLRDLADALDEAGIDSGWVDNIKVDGGFWINVTEVGGRWFVDPIASVSAYASLISDAAAK